MTVNERKIFIDCPGHLQAVLADNAAHGQHAVDINDYKEIILTHLHFDHADGLIELARHRAQIAERTPPDPQRIKLYAPDWMLKDLWSPCRESCITSAALFEGGAAALDRYFEPVPLGNPHDFGAFSLHTMPTRHSPRTVALKFDFGDYSLGYSADTGYDLCLLEWLYDCDLVIHEVFLEAMAEDDWLRDMHTPLVDLLQLPTVWQEKTLLCHYADSFSEHPDIGECHYLQQHRLYALPPV